MSEATRWTTGFNEHAGCRRQVSSGLLGRDVLSGGRLRCQHVVGQPDAGRRAGLAVRNHLWPCGYWSYGYRCHGITSSCRKSKLARLQESGCSQGSLAPYLVFAVMVGPSFTGVRHTGLRGGLRRPDRPDLIRIMPAQGDQERDVTSGQPTVSASRQRQSTNSHASTRRTS